MKNLLTILGSFTVTATGISTVVACSKATGKESDQPNPEHLTDQQKANQAAEELKILKILVEVADDAKTENNVIAHIKNATEVSEIISKYGATITGLIVNLKGGSPFDSDKIVGSHELEVSGKLKVGEIVVGFKLAKVSLKILDEDEVVKNRYY